MKKLILIFMLLAVVRLGGGTLGHNYSRGPVRGGNDAADLNCISGFNVWDITSGTKISPATTPAPVGATAPGLAIREVIDGSKIKTLG